MTSTSTTPQVSTSVSDNGSAATIADTKAVNAVNSAAATATTEPTTGSLYVGELHPDVTEAMIYELFSQIGPISSIRVCRDAITRRSLGYAYVNYQTTADCEKALEELNYVPLKGQPCRVMWSQRDPSMRRSGVGNIFIKNLNKEIDNKALHDLFSTFGNILSCKVVVDELTGESKGFGFVHYETKEAADLSIEKVNGMLLNGIAVYVGHHLSNRDRQSKADEIKQTFTNVFVKNLDDTIKDEEEFRSLFADVKSGEIQSAFLQRDSEGALKGFGFVNFTTHEAAEEAISLLNDKETNVPGKKLFVGRAQKKDERTQELTKQFESLRLERLSKFHGVNLYVKNLDEKVTEEALRKEFESIGTVTSLKIMMDDKAVSRGFGFVCYSQPEEAARAIAELNGKMVEGKPLYVALAQRREERKAQLETQFSQRSQHLRMQAMASASQAAASAMYGGGQAQQVVVGGAGPIFMHQQRAVNGGASAYMPRINNNGGRPAYVPRSSNANANNRQQQQQQHSSNPSATASGARRMPTSRMSASSGSAGVANKFRSLTAAALAAASPQEQKKMIGERLYPLVESIDAPNAGKITGMFLELDNGELLHLLEDAPALSRKVEEAQDVLRKHFESQAAAAAAAASAETTNKE